LQSPAVERLERTWARVDAYERRVLDELHVLANPARNWAVLRRAMESLAEKMMAAPPEEQTGCIPFLGIYLSDLVYNAELPAYVDRLLRPVNINDALTLASQDNISHISSIHSTKANSTASGHTGPVHGRPLERMPSNDTTKSFHSRAQSIGGQSIAPAVSAMMLIDRDIPLRSPRIASNSSDADTASLPSVIRVFAPDESQHQANGTDGSDSLASEAAPPPPLINYHRHRNSANVVRRVIAYQYLASRYQVQIDPEIRERLEDLHCLDNPTVHSLSREREPDPTPRIVNKPPVPVVPVARETAPPVVAR
jgi:hypothetical protein